MNEFFENVLNWFKAHVNFIIYGIVALAVIILALIIIAKVRSKKQKEQQFKENAENAVTSLTPEEIDRISNNVADKEVLIDMLASEEEEIQKAHEESAKKSAKQIKVKNSSDKSAKAAADKTAAVKVAKESKAEENSSVKADKSPAKKAAVSAEKAQKPDKAEGDNSEAAKQKTLNAAKQTKAATPDNKTKKSVNDKSEPEQKNYYTGKWKVKEQDGKFFAELTASNGGLLLRTETYTSLSGVKNGIETIKKNIDSGNFATSIDKYGHYRFKLFSHSNRLICVSENYSSKAKCESGIESVKRFAKTANVILDETVSDAGKE